MDFKASLTTLIVKRTAQYYIALMHVVHHFLSQKVSYVVSVCLLRVMMRETFLMKMERMLRTK